MIRTVHIFRILIMATGYSQEHQPDFHGKEWATPYGSISTDPDDFEGKSVLILGSHLHSVYPPPLFLTADMMYFILCCCMLWCAYFIAV